MGVTLPSAFKRLFTSSLQAITAGGLITIAHGLGVKPTFLQFEYEIITAFGNWNIGDTFIMDGFYIGGGSLNHFISADATNIYLNGATAGILAFNRTTGAPVLAPTLAHCQIRARAAV